MSFAGNDDDEQRDPEDPDPSDQDPDYDDGATETVDCPHCGKSIYEGSDFCHHCGKAVSAEEIASKRSVLFMIGMILCVLVMAAFVIGYMVAAFSLTRFALEQWALPWPPRLIGKVAFYSRIEGVLP